MLFERVAVKLLNDNGNSFEKLVGQFCIKFGKLQIRGYHFGCKSGAAHNNNSSARDIKIKGKLLKKEASRETAYVGGSGGGVAGGSSSATVQDAVVKSELFDAHDPYHILQTKTAGPNNDNNATSVKKPDSEEPTLSDDDEYERIPSGDDEQS